MHTVPGRRSAEFARLELGAALALMALPIALVVSDRWFNERQQLEWLRDLAGELVWRVESLGLPDYLTLVLACLAGLLALGLCCANPKTLLPEFLSELPTPTAAAQRVSARQQRAAGWLLGLSATATAWLTVHALAEEALLGLGWGLAAGGVLLGILGLQVPRHRLQAAWRQHAAPLAAMLLGLLNLVALLASLYSRWLPVWLTGLVFGLASLALWRLRHRLPAAYWLVLGALLFWSADINAWWLVAIGDEFAFYREARFIAFDAPLSLVSDIFFKGNFVYSAHPFLSTLLQSIFFKAWGDSNFAWRMSSLFYPALGLLFFDFFWRTFLTKRYALLATFVLAASHYLAAFGKVGYNNLQALLAFSLVLAAAAWVIRSHSPAASLALGLAQAFCFYVYPAALYIVPVPFLLLLFYDPPLRRAARQRWALTLGTLLLFLLPLLFQPLYWESKIAGTVAYTPALLDTSAGTFGHHLSSNFIYSLLSPLYTIEERHFIAVGNLDPLSAMLSFLGLALLLASFWRQRFLGFALLAFGLVFVLCGLSHDRQFPPNTRMFLLLPFLALFASLAVAWIKLQYSALKLSPGWGRGLVIGFVLLLMALNTYQAHTLTYQRMTGYQGFEGLFLRTSRSVWQAEPEATLLIIHQPAILDLTSLHEILAIYQVPYQPSQLVGISPQELEATRWQQFAGHAETLLLVDVRLTDAQLEAVQSRLQGLGKADCPVQHALGHTRLHLWHSAQFASLCPPQILPEGS